MTGPEHYRMAEQLMDEADALSRAYAVVPYSLAPNSREMTLLAEAQVHATLALAGATALCHPGDDETPTDVANAWYEAAGTRKAGEAR